MKLIDNTKLINDTLLFIAQKGWATKEQVFYDSLSLFLAKELDVAYVIIDKLNKDENTVETLSFISWGKANNSIAYSLKDTPCENVIGKNLCLYTRNIQESFPNDKMLVDLKAESYIGIPLWDTKGNPIGLIALMDTKPMDNPEDLKTILQIVAVRVAHEIERNNYERELEDKNSLLEIKNKELEQFAFIVSHDLQEPLRTLTGFAGLLKEEFTEELNEEADQYLDFILQSSKRMQELISGLLNFSRIGKMRKPTAVNCNQIVKEVLSDMHFSIQQSNAQISVEDLPKLNGYTIELRQLFQNLISNALKFKKENVIPKIHITAKKQGEYWQFSVQDNGIGIDTKDSNEIFTIFKRLHSRSKYEGTGIGLSYCKKIVKLHSGKIWVESQLEEGSTFYFTIKEN
jgi:signal transduction histidine kinase